METQVAFVYQHSDLPDIVIHIIVGYMWDLGFSDRRIEATHMTEFFWSRVAENPFRARFLPVANLVWMSDNGPWNDVYRFGEHIQMYHFGVNIIMAPHQIPVREVWVYNQLAGQMAILIDAHGAVVCRVFSGNYTVG